MPKKKIIASFKDSTDKIKEIVETEENEKRDNLKLRITSINDAEICIEIYGDAKKTEVFFADLKIKLEKLFDEVLHIEYASDISNTTHKIIFKGKRDTGAADEIISIFSKYEEGTPDRKGDYED